MKVLALNSSPRVGVQSKTELMLDQLVDGMRAAGAEVEVVNLHGKTIQNCIGCYTCWTKTPGICLHKDDMAAELFPKWKEADLVVYATPLYNYTVNATLKTFIERTLPSLEPFFEIHDDRMIHPLRNKIPAVVVLSVAGMPDEGHFHALSAYFQYYLKSPGRRLVSEIYRPAAEMMTNPFVKEKAKDILAATVQAGRELVKSMAISAETMTRICQPIMAPELFAEVANLFWKSCIAEEMTPKEFKKKNRVPRPESLESFMLLFPTGINRQASANGPVVLQFTFSGDVAGSCHFIVRQDKIDAENGRHENPDVSIAAPFEVWMDIMTGKADGQAMFMEQKYTVEGDFALMLALFGRG